MKAFLLLLALASTALAESDYRIRVAEAEAVYQQKSYADAHELYVQLKAGTPLEPGQARWVDFRLADTQWRSQAATETSDPSTLQQAQKDLEKLVRDVALDADRDRVWAEVHESLGDYFWTRRNDANWSSAWPHYQFALDWWAGANNVDEARPRYLGIVWRAARPPWADAWYRYGNYGNRLPPDVLENARTIARADEDKARAGFLLATALQQQGGWNQAGRVAENFEAALKFGAKSDWHDDALYNYALWMMSWGRRIEREDGNDQRAPDFVKALELFRRLTKEFNKGESRFFDEARQQIENITREEVGVQAPNFFLPESDVSFNLTWRNVKRADITLYEVDLTKDVPFSDGEKGAGDWLQLIDLKGREKFKALSRETEDQGDYQPGSAEIKLKAKIPAGAYIVEARAGAASAREVLLITDAALVLKTSGRQVLAYAGHAMTGSPIAGARIFFAERVYDGKHWRWHTESKQADTSGLAVLDRPESTSRGQLFVSVAKENRQAFGLGYNYYAQTDQERTWKIYAFTDRPAYRPEDRVQWKFIARTYDGNVYATPAGATVDYEISDPQGAKVATGHAKLNGFGSAWGELALTDKMPLGEYGITLWDEGRHQRIGDATLFRLEEYKLPEFKVAVETPEENGRKKTYLLGETVEAVIQADYYFGGPVANAAVEILVYQNPWNRSWWEPRSFDWFYGDLRPQPGWWGQGPVVKRETVKTDASGRATISFESPRGGQDFEYRIEARVTDASRREIVGQGAVRVTRQRYYAEPRAEHQLYKPQDKVVITVKTLDANDQPIQAEGLVKVTRDRWITNAYEHEDILSRTVTTSTNGTAEFTFTPGKEGFYRVAWTGPQKGGPRVTAETTVWVATDASTDLGYRHGGLEIIVDKDTFRSGQKAPVMLCTHVSDRYVLFSVEADDLQSYELVHLDGTVKLIELPIEEKHVPNIFLNGAMISDGEFFVDTKQVIVPPLKNFLNISVAADKEVYEPREESSLIVTATDSDGRPVAAEIALSLTDESVFYIQDDYAGDPRQFFFGGKRWQQVQTQSSFQQKRYPSEEKNARHDYRNERAGGEFADRLSSLNGEIAPAAMSVVDDKAEGFVAMGGAKAAAMDEREAQPSEPAVVVRADFRATALWRPDLVTDARGRAQVKVNMPESLTSWRATARAATAGSQFGVSNITVITRQPLIVRLQAPRFFVVGDTCTVSAVINNNTDESIEVKTHLDVSGLVGAAVSDRGSKVPAHGEARVDWLVRAEKSGEATLKITARGGKYADAMTKTYTVYEHGIEKFVADSAKLREHEVAIHLDLPKERKDGTTSLTVYVAPSVAVTMLDALPYLADYPYGCTEQTMSRFLPAAVTAKTLKDLGLKPEAVADKLFGGIHNRVVGASLATPAGRASAAPTLSSLDAMIAAGLDRLYDFQHDDGGWGWWKQGESDHFMTAHVAWGLALAKDAGVDVRGGVVQRALKFLDEEIVEEEEGPDQQAWMLHALSAHRFSSKQTAKAMENLFMRRDELNAYTRALLVLSAQQYGDPNKIAAILSRNLRNGVKRGEETAHWGEDGFWWRWSEGGVEATAFALKALLAVDPQSDLVEPTMNWLVKNRRGAQWSNTRDTALVVLALNDYLRASRELESDQEYELFVNGESVGTQRVTKDNSISAPSRFDIGPKLILDGTNEIKVVRKSGTGALYLSAQAKYFSLEEPITPAGNEIFVERQYNKLVGRPTLLKGYVYDHTALNDGESVASGDRVETVITIEAKNNYEYLVFEDLKPAGFEAVDLRSGESLFAKEIGANGEFTGRTRWVYQELRDRKVALFLDKLPEGVWEIRYDLRAESPGTFHALPTLGHAMYVPEIRCNGAEIRASVVERGE